MNVRAEPMSAEEAVKFVRGTARLLPVGAGTKPRLAQVEPEVARISTLGLRGIVEYEPEEFTITALAGTPVREIVAALAARRQYLPFDPLFTEAGASIGGTVAAGANGPGRFRFGGVRDFILGVRFIDGSGRLLRMGGKVVKNAAGFDLPKFMVGSCGRFGFLVEVTFKVFPRATATQTLILKVANPEEAAQILLAAAKTRWELDALDLSPWDGSVLMRLAGPEEGIGAIAQEILARWPGQSLAAAEAQALWNELGEATWAHVNGLLIKATTTPSQVLKLTSIVRELDDGRMHVTSGGSVAMISLARAEQVSELSQALSEMGARGVVWRGGGPLFLGHNPRYEIAQAVKQALDPNNRFPGLDT